MKKINLEKGSSGKENLKNDNPEQEKSYKGQFWKGKIEKGQIGKNVSEKKTLWTKQSGKWQF